MSTIVGLLASNAKTKWIIEQAGLYDCFRSDHLVIADGVPESRRRDPAPGLRRYTTVRYIEFLQTNVCQCGFSISVENGRDLFLSYDSFFFSSFSLSLSLSLFLSQSCVLNMCKWKFDRKISFGTKKLNFGWKMNTRKSVRISFVPKKIFSRCDFIWDFMNIYIYLFSLILIVSLFFYRCLSVLSSEPIIVHNFGVGQDIILAEGCFFPLFSIYHLIHLFWKGIRSSIVVLDRLNWNDALDVRTFPFCFFFFFFCFTYSKCCEKMNDEDEIKIFKTQQCLCWNELF